MKEKPVPTLDRLRSVLPEEGRGKTRRWRSMVYKMIAVTGLLLLGASIAGGVSAYWVSSSAIEQEIQFTGQQLVTSLAGSITTVIKEDKDELQRALNKLLAKDPEKRIENAFILDENFRILAAKDVRMVGNDHPNGPHLSKLQLKEVHVLEGKKGTTTIAAPVQWGKKEAAKLLGYVVFSFSQNAINNARNSIIVWFSLVFFFAFGCTILITRYVMKRLLKPVVKLGVAANELAKGNFEHPIEAPQSNDEIGVAIMSFIQMQERIGKFLMFTNRPLARKIISGDLKAEDRNLVVSFGDMKDFTDKTGNMAAEDVAGICNRYFTLHGQVIESFDGYADKFEGDCVMSVFGHDTRDNPRLRARNAIRAKIYTQHIFSLANYAMHSFRSLPVMQFRFGLASGKMILGPMGDKHRKMDYTVIGKPVNLSSRIEALSTVGGLEVDKFTFLDAGGNEFLIASEPVNHKDMKGFEKEEGGIDTYQIFGFRDPEETELMRQFVREYFRNELVQAELMLTPEQLEEFLNHVERKLSEKQLVLPTPLLAD